MPPTGGVAEKWFDTAGVCSPTSCTDTVWKETRGMQDGARVRAFPRTRREFWLPGRTPDDGFLGALLRWSGRYSPWRDAPAPVAWPPSEVFVVCPKELSDGPLWIKPCGTAHLESSSDS